MVIARWQRKFHRSCVVRSQCGCRFGLRGMQATRQQVRVYVGMYVCACVSISVLSTCVYVLSISVYIQRSTCVCVSVSLSQPCVHHYVNPRVPRCSVARGSLIEGSDSYASDTCVVLSLANASPMHPNPRARIFPTMPPAGLKIQVWIANAAYIIGECYSYDAFARVHGPERCADGSGWNGLNPNWASSFGRQSNGNAKYAPVYGNAAKPLKCMLQKQAYEAAAKTPSEAPLRSAWRQLKFCCGRSRLLYASFSYVSVGDSLTVP